MNYINSAIDDTVKSTVLPNELNLWEINETCDKCRFPLHLRSGGVIAFCPRCHDKNEWARKGQALLAEARRREIELKAAQFQPQPQRLPTFQERCEAEQKKKDECHGPFLFGMPL